MDNSPELKLRRDSNGSRDNSYMDFAQGIDSDIEEVDNAAEAEANAALPSEPEAVDDELDFSVIPPPPLAMMPPISQSQTLSTVSEHDDDLPSPPLSPTSSVLEMLPPAPVDLSPETHSKIHNINSPALETDYEEEEEDEQDIEIVDVEGGVERELVSDMEAGNIDDELIPPPQQAVSPIELSASPYTEEDQLPQPMQGSTPSISPSPPITPPPCPELTSLAKIVSPPPVHISQIPPLTPPSESDHSQPHSPPPPKRKQSQTLMPTTPPSPPQCDANESDIITPPPEHVNVLDEDLEVADVLNIASMDLVQDVLQDLRQDVEQEDIKSNIDDESTTITTPPTNGYSASSIVGEQTEDAIEQPLSDILLANIPPPMMLDGYEEEEPDEDDEDDKSDYRHSFPLSETKPLDLDAVSPEPVLLSTEGEEGGEPEPESESEGEQIDIKPGTPTSQISQLSQAIPSPTASASPKRKDSISSIGKSSQQEIIQAPQMLSGESTDSASRRGSREVSRNGSIREIPQSPVQSVKSQKSDAEESVRSLGKLEISPTESEKSIQQTEVVPEEQEELEEMEEKAIPSPVEADKAPEIPSPPKLRSPSPPRHSPPPPLHSPAEVTSPPTIYSPESIERKITIETETPPEEESKEVESAETEKRTITDSLPSTASSTLTTVTTTLSYLDEQQQQQQVQQLPDGKDQQQMVKKLPIIRHQISSHHHYHLPHQFQHPHHQNHHPHTHGALPVCTPTVPATYTSSISVMPESRHRRAPSSSGTEETVLRRLTPSSSAATVTSSSHILIPATTTAGRISESSSQHRVTIDETNLQICGGDGGDEADGGSDDNGSGGPPSPGTISSQQQLTVLDHQQTTSHMTLMYHHHSSQMSNLAVPPLPPSALKRAHRPSFIYPPMTKIKAGDTLATLFSALYGKLLVVMGIAFPMAEVISTYIPPSFYEVYYLYLYIGSMIFLLFMYATLIWGRPKIPPSHIGTPIKSAKQVRSTTTSESLDESDTDSNSMHKKRLSLSMAASARRPSLLAPLGRQHHFGSFYLRMGAVAFGIGSMIYSGLEFGQYFELNPDTKCHNVMLALTPATRMAFIFIQMYFIFLNNEQIKVYRYKVIARFGLMHMIGTNLAVWLNVLIQETKHEILTFYNPENRTLRISHRIPGHSRAHSILAPADPSALIRVPRGLKGPYQIFECRRTNILGTLVQDASPFLFPCTIEYSLICAAILYVMWRSISRPPSSIPPRPDMISSPVKRSPHHYSVDCARAHKGLFVGILMLVLTIISLILFFVLISRPDFVALAVMEVTVCELFIYATATIATLLGMIQIRHLQYDAFRSFSLDDILLVGAQTGSFLYNIFTVIAGHFSLRSDDWLVPINALASIVQTACQTMFILDAGRRRAIAPEHIRKKPGREIVTFMLVVNLAMWAISTLEKSRAESHPIQLNFYGLWAWTIITHVSMPLAIFYRFHSTVCLCEIWKRAYKLKPTYM